MRIVLLFLILFTIQLNNNSFSQEIYTKSEQFNGGIALRGKAMAYVVIEDAFLYNYTIGTEFRFLKRHSLGVDYVFYRESFEQDIYDTIKKEETGEGPNKHDTRKYLYLDYKYYLGTKRLGTNRATPYVNCFARLGIRNTHEQKGYILEPDESFNYHASFQHYGVSLGTIIGLNENHRFGLDVNLGLGKKYSKVTEDVYSGNGVFEHISNRKEEKMSLYMRLNFYYYLGRW